MAPAKMAQIKSRIKVDNANNYKYTVGEELECKLEGQSKYNSHLVVVFAKETHKSNKKGKKTDRKITVGHVLDVLAEVLFLFVAT